MQEVAQKTGLSEAQVYKWGWDQKWKFDENPSEDAFSSRKIPSEEIYGVKWKIKSNFKGFN